MRCKGYSQTGTAPREHENGCGQDCRALRQVAQVSVLHMNSRLMVQIQAGNVRGVNCVWRVAAADPAAEWR